MLASLSVLVLLVVPAILEWQFWLITLAVVPILAEVYRLLVVKLVFVPSKFHMTIAISLISLLLSLLFSPGLFVGLPPIDVNFMAFLEGLVAAIGLLVGTAKIIYDILWDRIFDAIAKAGVKPLAYRLEGA